jgi:hypothetical protein
MDEKSFPQLSPPYLISKRNLDAASWVDRSELPTASHFPHVSPIQEIQPLRHINARFFVIYTFGQKFKCTLSDEFSVNILPAF